MKFAGVVAALLVGAQAFVPIITTPKNPTNDVFFNVDLTTPVSNITTSSFTTTNCFNATLTGGPTNYVLRCNTFDAAVVMVSLGAGAVRSDANTLNEATAITNVTADFTPPGFTIGWLANPTNFPSFSVTGDGAVGNLVNLLTTTNCQNLQQVVSGNFFQLFICKPIDGVISVSVPANAVVDAAGNANLATPVFSVTSDITPPTVTLTAQGVVNGWSNRTSTTIVFGFSEPLVNFGLHSVSSTCPLQNYQLVTPTMATAHCVADDGAYVEISVLQFSACDAATNCATSLPSISFRVDALDPSFQVNITANGAAVQPASHYIASNITFLVNFTEPVVVLTQINSTCEVEWLSSKSARSTCVTTNPYGSWVHFEIGEGWLRDGFNRTNKVSFVLDAFLNPSAPQITVDFPTLLDCNASASGIIPVLVQASEPVRVALNSTPIYFLSNTTATIVNKTDTSQMLSTHEFSLIFLDELGGNATVFVNASSFVDIVDASVSPSQVQFVQYGTLPSIVSVVAGEPANPDIYDTLFDTGDSVLIDFDEDTNTLNRCPICATSTDPNLFVCDQIMSKAEIEQYFTFSISLGEDYYGTWSSCRQLKLTMVNTTGHGDLYDLKIGLQPANCSSVTIRNARSTSPIATHGQNATHSLSVVVVLCKHFTETENHTCNCRNEYIGRDCSVKCVVNNTHLTEEQQLSNICGPTYCKENYHGDDCSIKCLVAAGFGTVLGSRCSCKQGYYGDACENWCAQGTFHDPSTDTCPLCPPGSFSADTANAICQNCVNGTFQAQAGQSQCQTCPAGTSTKDPILFSENQCAPDSGRFRVQKDTGEVITVACQNEKRCRWWDGVDAWRGVVLKATNVSETVLWCIGDNYVGDCYQCRCDESNDDIGQGSKECYTGYECGRCHSGYYQSGNICKRCTGTSTWIYVVVVISFVVVLMLFYFVAPYFHSIGTFTIGFNFFQLIALVSKFNGLNLPAPLQRFISGLSFFAFSSQLVRPECQGNFFVNVENRILLVLVLPAFVLALLLLSFSLVVICKKTYLHFIVRRNIQTLMESQHQLTFPSTPRPLWHSMREGAMFGDRLEDVIRGTAPAEPVMIKHIALHRAKKRFNTSTRRGSDRFSQILDAVALTEDIRDTTNVRHTIDLCIHTFMMFLSVFYITIASETISVFDCSWKSELREYRLDNDPSITCWVSSGPWPTLAWRAAVGIVFYVFGIPALFGLILLTHKRELDSPRVVARYGFVYERFARGFFMWELTIVARKFMFVVVQQFFGANTNISMCCCLLILFVFIMLHVYVQPYSTTILNQLETLLLSGNFFILILVQQLLFSDFAAKYGQVISTLVIATVALLIVLCGQVLLIEVRRRAHDLQGCLGRIFKVKKQRAHVIATVIPLAEKFLDRRSTNILKSWIAHHAAYSDLLLWKKFLQEFEKFSERIGREQSVAEVENTPNINSEFVPEFFAWMSKARRDSLQNCARLLTSMRIYKRWEQSNERRVQRFVLSTLRRYAQQGVIDRQTLSLPARRWKKLRVCVCTGHWRNLFPHESNQTQEVMQGRNHNSIATSSLHHRSSVVQVDMSTALFRTERML